MSSPSERDADLIPAAPGARPMRADAQRNRARILAAARDAFAAHGLAVQMEDVARQAQVGVGTIYRHFPTKEALVAAVIVELLTELSTAVRAAYETNDAWAAFEGVVWRMATVMVEDRALTEAIQTNPEIMAAVAVAMRAYIDVLAQLVTRAQAAGVLRRDIVAGDLIALVSSVATVFTPPDLPEPQQAPWRRYTRILLDGLRNP